MRSATIPAAFVVQESGGFAPRGKYHLAREKLGDALCGREPARGVVWNVTGERVRFEEHVPERICKLCRRAENAPKGKVFPCA